MPPPRVLMVALLGVPMGPISSGVTTDFTTLTTPARTADDRFSHTIPDGWQQGRGAFGGFVLAALARAITHASGRENLQLRSLTATLPGPTMVGAAEITVESLRAGSGTSTLAARLTQGGAVCAHAVAVLGRDRARDADSVAVVPPEMPPWQTLPVFALRSNGVGPPFAEHMEFRNTGPALFSGASPRASGWVRMRSPGSARDAAYLIGMADAWWPSIFSRLPAPRPMATIAFTIQFFADCVGLDAAAPLFYEARTDAMRDGYAAETRTLWGGDGRLLAINTQTFVLIQ